MKTAAMLVNQFTMHLEKVIGLSKQGAFQLDYVLSASVVFISVMHGIASYWLYLGMNVPGSWVKDQVDGLNTPLTTVYISSIYWCVTTMTMVGYGDIWGYTWQEYLFNIGVEFIGIAFFSFVTGLIANFIVTEDVEYDSVEYRLEQADIWLYKLDNLRTNKSLPKFLYETIRSFIEEALNNDHHQLIKNYEFLEKLKPNLRASLIKDIFPDYLFMFKHFFEFDDASCGEEFKSFFVSQIHCKIFLANQVIIEKGDKF